MKIHFIKYILYTSIIMFLGAALISSCHKYTEDPFISFKKPWRRLTGVRDSKMGYVGIWKITSYKINGTEHYSDFDSILTPFNCRLLDCSIYFYNTGDKPYGDFMFKKNFIFDKASYDFSKATADDTYGFELTFNVVKRDTFLYKFFHPLQIDNNSQGTFYIKKLYNKDLHLQAPKLDIYFKKQD